MKIWCEECKGKGYNIKETITRSFYFEKCVKCNGEGYLKKQCNNPEKKYCVKCKSYVKPDEDRNGELCPNCRGIELL